MLAQHNAPALDNSISDPQTSRCLQYWQIALLALAAMALGAGISRRDGLYSQGAIFWLNIAVASVGLALLPIRIRLAPWLQRLPILVLLVALAFQFTTLYQRYPGTLWNTSDGDPRKELSIKRDALTWIQDRQKRDAARNEVADLEARLIDGRFRTGLLIAAGLSILALLPWKPLRHIAIPLILLLHLALGAWLIQKTPDPYIDVYVFQQESCDALLRGENPYATTFTNIYGEGAYVYAPNLMKDGRVNFGYPYTPLSLFLALPGYLLMGDHRFSQLAALTLAGAFLAYARPGRLATLAMLLLLFTPRIFMIVEMGWTEPFVVMLLAATIFCACRFPRATPYVLGLLLASKQYMLFAIPLAALLLPHPFRWKDYLTMMLKAALLAAVVSLPLALWDLPRFIWSAVTLQLIQPFRQDSISYLAWFAWIASPAWAAKLAWLAFAAAIAMIILALRRCPRSPQGFAAGLAVVYLAFLALNKQAFCNYYFLVIGMLTTAIAIHTQTTPSPPPCPTTPPSIS